MLFPDYYTAIFVYGAALGVAPAAPHPHPSVDPSRASYFLETGKF